LDVDERYRVDLREEIKKRVEREIDLLGKATSPYIVKLGLLRPTPISIQGHEFIAYSEELLDGPDLQSLIQSGSRPSEDELLLAAECLVKAVKDLWFNLGTVHRDIKPLNVIKTDIVDRPFVLLDLGIAFSIYETALTVDPSQRFPPPGTTRYLAPEMLRPDFRDSLDYRSDLYTIGVTLYEYACGQHPLARDRDDMLLTLSRIAKEIPKPIEVHRADLSIKITTIINQLLKKLPALRGNIKTIEQALEL
jgi:serine/threonine-protein kinase